MSTPNEQPSAPSTPSEGSEDFTGAEHEIDWEALNSDVSPGADDEDGNAAAGTAPPTQAKATEQKPAPAAKTTTETTTTAKTPSPPAEEAEVELDAEGKPKVAPPATQPQPQAPLTPEQVAEQQRQFSEWEKGELDKMEQQYAASLSDDDVAALQTEPEKVIPRLAAQVRMDTMKATLSAVGQLLPGLLQGHNQQAQLENQARDAFFGKNDDLRDVPMDKILKAGHAYRQMNPDVKDPEEVIIGVGNMVRAVLKRQARADTPPAAKKTAPSSGSKNKGYSPAGGGGRPSPAAAPKDDGTNVWSELADDD